MTKPLALALFSLMAMLQPAAAEYPEQPITLVVGYAAGGAVDTAARVIAEHLQARFKQTVLVENRPGSGSLIASNFVAKAQPDGYTLLFLDCGTVSGKWVNKSTPFDVLKDFSPVALIAITPLVLFAHPSVPFQNFAQLIAFAKANPGKLSVGSAGIGTAHHFAAIALNIAAQIDITHVPYRGVAPALQDLLGGQIPLMWGGPTAVMPFVAEGKAKALAVSTRERNPLLPDVPAVAEAIGYEFDIANWVGVIAPAGTPPSVVERVAGMLGIISKLPKVQQRMQTLGFHPDFRAGSEFREMIIAEYWKYGAIARAAHVQPE
jgi:tripartite-type tricarboxylate transporter receptor subunit TctC